MEFTITKEQILEVAKWGDSQNEKQIKEWFPEAFESELKVGKWYYNEKYNTVFYLAEFKYDDVFNGYGFNKDKEWFSHNEHGNIYAKYCNREATEEEVEEAFVKEAKKRFGKDWKNAKIINHADKKTWKHLGLNKNSFMSGYSGETLYNNNGVIFINGVWAEPLIEEKTTISKEKALKIIAKKLKVSPENIEIK